MLRRSRWIQTSLRILQHDLTLVTTAVALAVATLALMAAALRMPAENAPVSPLSVDVAAAPPFELAPGVDETALLEPPAEPVERRVTAGEIGRGETLARSLGRRGVDAEVVHAIAREMSPHFDFRHAQPGDRYQLSQDLEGGLVAFQYHPSELEHYELTREGEGYHVERREATLTPRIARLAGVVSSTVHEAVVQLGEQGQLASDLADIFAWDIDFTRSVNRGDEFRVLYERLYRSDDELGDVYVRPGRILAARYDGAAGQHTAIYFEPQEGRGGYYRPDGSSVEGQFLRAPLRYSRISSRYTSARRHPILKITRPHHGIDYAAKTGTPIWSVGDGKVIYKGWGGGFGNLVKIRHAKGYVSYYAHLSRFARGLRVGQVVQQKQVIGYVGSTGLATGPHVCFRIAKDGKYVDPIRVKEREGDPVRSEVRPLFDATRDLLLSELDAGPLVAADEAL